MIKKIWAFSGDIRLSFILLMTASATLFGGSIYANSHFSLFRELNRITVQDWFGLHFQTLPGLAWWIPVLFVVMGFLGINTFVCASTRIHKLFKHRGNFAASRLAYLLIPSFIHFVFILITFGHLLTFTMGNWKTIPIETGMTIPFKDTGEALTVLKIKNRFYAKHSGMKDRIAQTFVSLETGDQEAIELQFAKPVFYKGSFLFLDKEKKKNKLIEPSKNITPAPSEDPETCNQAHVYLEKPKEKNDSKLFLLVVTDPGIVFIIAGLTLILCLMLLFYLIQPKKEAGFTTS